jgi:hypothetical protein
VELPLWHHQPEFRQRSIVYSLEVEKEEPLGPSEGHVSTLQYMTGFDTVARGRVLIPIGMIQKHGISLLPTLEQLAREADNEICSRWDQLDRGGGSVARESSVCIVS